MECPICHGKGTRGGHFCDMCNGTGNAFNNPQVSGGCLLVMLFIFMLLTVLFPVFIPMPTF